MTTTRKALPSKKSVLGKAPALVAAAGAAAALALFNARRASGAERQHPPIGRRLLIDGIHVHVAEWGQGSPVVLIHGNGTMVHDWAVSGLAERLARDHRVIAIDRPGYGYTERPRDRAWTPEAQAALIATTLRRIGVERAVIVGHSWGALTALALGLDHPEMAQGLVLLSGYYVPTVRPDAWAASGPAIPGLGDVLRYTIAPPLSAMIAPKLIAKVFAPRPVPARFAKGFPLALALRPFQLRGSAADSALMVPAAARLRDRYADLSVPTAILAGDGDGVVDPWRHAIALHQAIEGSTLQILPGLGHMIHYDAQDEIAEAVAMLQPNETPRAHVAGTRSRLAL
ncbi:MAG TPA: alpha/beta hydrolase [Beijerinckiaceae bacterium]|jgi:pimeloyl-ACP methyl ester carboxylesterase